MGLGRLSSGCEEVSWWWWWEEEGRWWFPWEGGGGDDGMLCGSEVLEGFGGEMMSFGRTEALVLGAE